MTERRLFDQASLVHLTSDLEEYELRRLGIRARTVVIPNGLDLDGEFAASRIAEARTAGIPEVVGRRVVLFLSRIHPKKGLDLLCRVWAGLPPHLPVLLLVAGPGDEAYVAELRRWLAEQAGPPAQYVGPVTGDRKLALLSSAWLMALPSRSENYGMVVAEAWGWSVGAGLGRSRYSECLGCTSSSLTGSGFGGSWQVMYAAF